MFLEFLSDRTTHYLDRQFMLGPSLLVAPVFVPVGEELEYYLPAGRWTSFFHPEQVLTGPLWVKEAVALDEIPVWVRPSTVLCLGAEKTGRPDYELANGVEMRLYEVEEGCKINVNVPSGATGEVAGTVTVERRVGEVSVRVVSGDVRLGRIALFGQDHAEGRVIVVQAGNKDIVIEV